MSGYLRRLADFFVGLWYVMLISYIPGTATLWLLRLLRLAVQVALVLFVIYLAKRA